ncbi:MAG: glycosyltransferase family 4 protein [Anaerolineaceae bacterium]
MLTFDGHVGLIQRVLPEYRASFFDTLAGLCRGGLDVFAGEPRPAESIQTAQKLNAAHLTLGRNLHLFSGKAYLCLQLGLIDWLRETRPDVLIVEANPRYLRTPAAIRWMHSHGKPVIGWGLGAPQITGPFRRLRGSSRHRLLKQFDALITYSQQGAEQYCALGFPAQRVFVAPNAAAPRPNHPLPQRSASFTGAPRLLFVGRLQARKRLDVLLRACAMLPAQIQPDLDIVGDGPARAELETLASAVYPRAKFHGAHTGDALLPFYAAADLFVLPGTGGLAVQQAMAHALPVMVAEADGTQADLVRPGNGWQLPTGVDEKSLADALSQALAQPSRLREMGVESFRIVREEINLETMAEVFIGAIGSIINVDRSTSPK